MNAKPSKSQQRQDVIAGAVLTVLLGLIFLTSPIGEGLRNLSYELPFRLRSTIPVTNVVMVYMDERSHNILDQPFDQPWDRSLHADLLQKLTDYGAKAIVFDVHFGSRGDPDKDTQFLNAIKRHGNVVVAAYPTVESSEVGQPIWRLTPPFSELAEIASWGVVEVTLAEDPFVRRHYQGLLNTPSLACRVAELTMAKPPTCAPEMVRWVNYYGPPFSLTNYSYWQVWSNNILPEAVSVFSNKVVFVGSHVSIGFPAGRPEEYFRTPYGLVPGTEINATTYLNLLRGDWLTELSLGGELILISLCGVLLGFGLMRFRPFTAIGVAIGCGIAFAVFAFFWVWTTHIWLPWMIVVVVQLPCATGWVMLKRTRGIYVEKGDLEQRLEAIQQEVEARYPKTPSGQPSPLPRSASLYVPALPLAPPVVRSPSGELDATADLVAPAVPDHTLLRCIGEGAYGQVWLARDAIGTYHAVKLVYRQTFQSAGPFEREFRGIQKFTPISRSHPGFVHVLHVGINQEGGYFYYVMEIGDDEKLGQEINPDTYAPKNFAGELKKRGKLPEEECLQISLDLTAALEHLHTHQLIHRDIKPSNIIYVNSVLKFADIGLVTDVATTGKEVSYLGTEGYMAPEGPGTPATDVYSLGKVLYEAITGLDRRRFPELPTAVMATEKSPLLFQLNKIILKACEKDPAQRYQTVVALREDLMTLKTEGPLKRIAWWRRAFFKRKKQLRQKHEVTDHEQTF